jgi:hypothetical protein
MENGSKTNVDITFEPYAEPKVWRSDIGEHTAYGDIVVTCAQHGEVIRFLATNPLTAERPETHGNATLWRGNHLRSEHADGGE